MPRILIAITLLVIMLGAINWLLVGAFEFDLVAAITGNEFGETNAASRIIYIVVGISGVVQLVDFATMFRGED